MENLQEQTVRPLRVAAYIRVSTEMGSQEDSFEYQKRYFTHLLSTRPVSYTHLDVYKRQVDRIVHRTEKTFEMCEYRQEAAGTKVKKYKEKPPKKSR